MAAFRKSILVLMLLAIGIAAQGCATASKTANEKAINESSELDRVHNDRIMRVVERADNATRRFNQ